MGTYIRKVIYILTVIPALNVFLTAQMEKLPDSPQGKIVRSYIDAFNSGDSSKMREYFLTNIPAEALREPSMETRLERFLLMRSDIKSITVLKVPEISDTHITLTAKTGRDQIITLLFNFTPTAPYKLAQLRIEQGEVQAASGPPLKMTDALDSIKTYINDQAAADKFSGSVLIAIDTSVILEHAYGSADKRFSAPNTIDTKFNLGSINKIFTRIAIGQLAEKNKLSFNDHIIKYLPDYPNKTVAKKVTIKQLYSMTSGLGDFLNEQFENTPKNKIRTIRDYLPFFVHDSLEFEPGTKERYSNASYIVLGLIIEKLSGKDYYLYMREHIYKPSGMKNTDHYQMDAVIPALSTGYQREKGSDNRWVSNIYTAPARGSSTGGGYSTVHDLFNFLHALQNGKLLSPRFTAWILTEQLLSKEPKMPIKQGDLVILGGAPGINAAISFDAATGYTVIALANYDPPSATEIVIKCRGLLKRIIK